MSTTLGGRPGQQELAIRLALAQAEATPDGLLIVSPDGRILSTNPRFTELWRVDQELIASGDAKRALEHAVGLVADPDAFVARVRQVYADPVPTHEEVALADGRVLDRYGAPLYDDAGDYIGYAWWFRDVTPSKEAQAALRELADTLQASLLPPRPPHIPGMEVAARYRPGSPGMTVGGDFYDVFRLRDDAWGVVLGDVCGKGAQAAALTALARYSVRAAAVHNDMPSDVLRELNAALLDEPELRERFCALVFAKFEQDTCGAWVTLSCAGHPLPLVVRRSGWVDVRGQPALLAGLFDDMDVTDDLVGLGPGDAIMICTDGITEARGHDGELFGEERLFSVLSANAGREPGVIADAVIEAALAFSARPIDDDVAILVLRVPPNAADDPEGRLRAVGVTPAGRASTCATAQARQAQPRPPREARLPLRADTSCAPEARAFVNAVLRSWRMAELAGGDPELIASELVSNALLHTGTPEVVVVRYDGERVRVEVGDGSRVLPRAGTPSKEASAGRGLGIVSAIATGWGAMPTLRGKRVWAEVATDQHT